MSIRLHACRTFAFVVVVLLCCIAGGAGAQSTAFTYQGKLTDGGNPANGNYDLQFKLFDTASVGTGTQQGSTVVTNPVTASAGVFTVTLDFGQAVFSGLDRYLEIGVRPSGSVNAYTTLSPRQHITSSPYAIQTLDTQQLGGLPASRYVASASNGNVGIGTATPTGGKLHVEGGSINAIYGNSSAGDGVAGISGTGIGVYGKSTSFEGVRGEAADVNHGGVVGIHSNNGIGVYGSTAGGAGVQGAATTGNAVVGGSTSGYGVFGSSSSSAGVFGQTSIASPAAAGVYGKGLVSGALGVVGESNINDAVGVYGVSTSTTGYGVFARDPGGTGLYVDGNARQTLANYGIAKALVLGYTPDSTFDASNVIVCYNGPTNSYADNRNVFSNACGFTVASPGKGILRINFGFTITNSFVLATCEYGTTLIGPATFGHNCGVNYRKVDATTIDVFTFDLVDSADTLAGKFMLILF